MVYAADLKSADQKSCGFESHLAHHDRIKSAGPKTLWVRVPPPRHLLHDDRQTLLGFMESMNGISRRDIVNTIGHYPMPRVEGATPLLHTVAREEFADVVRWGSEVPLRDEDPVLAKRLDRMINRLNRRRTFAWMLSCCAVGLAVAGMVVLKAGRPTSSEGKYPWLIKEVFAAWCGIAGLGLGKVIVCESRVAVAQRKAVCMIRDSVTDTCDWIIPVPPRERSLYINKLPSEAMDIIWTTGEIAEAEAYYADGGVVESRPDELDFC